MNFKSQMIFSYALVSALVLAAPKEKEKPSAAPKALTGEIVVDGSSTVFPILEAVAEEYGKTQPKVKVTVGTSGTGGGFKKFCRGETDISNASRPIKSSEAEICAKNKVSYVELPIGFDGITLVRNRKNTFATCLTTAELKSIWEPDSKVNSWKQVRASFPDKPITLFGPGHDSGTFDYFTDAINGKESVSRKDFTASEDDNVLVRGVEATESSLGYFGYSYYVANKAKLGLIEVDSGKGCVAPSSETIKSGTYAPLSRPLFVYVSTKALERPETVALLTWFLNHPKETVESTGYVVLSPKLYTVAQDRLKQKVTDSIFAKGGSAIGVNLEQLYTSKK